MGVPLGSGHGEWKAGVSDWGCCDGCLVDGSRDGSAAAANLFGFALMVWQAVYSLVGELMGYSLDSGNLVNREI